MKKIITSLLALFMLMLLPAEIRAEEDYSQLQQELRDVLRLTENDLPQVIDEAGTKLVAIHYMPHVPEIYYGFEGFDDTLPLSDEMKALVIKNQAEYLKKALKEEFADYYEMLKATRTRVRIGFVASKGGASDVIVVPPELLYDE